jgi:hypothetical protein
MILGLSMILSILIYLYNNNINKCGKKRVKNKINFGEMKNGKKTSNFRFLESRFLSIFGIINKKLLVFFPK